MKLVRGDGKGRVGGNRLPVASGVLGGVYLAVNKNHKGKAVLSVRTKAELVSVREVGLRMVCVPFNHILCGAPANMANPMVILMIFYINKAIDVLKEIMAWGEGQVNK